MIIRNFDVTSVAGAAQVSAEVVWEESARASFDLHFRVPTEHAALISANADAFLTAALYPARRAGERRVRVEGEVCPYLVRGLETALHWHWHWFGERCPIVAIEAPARTRPIATRDAAGALLFFSGGADCMHTLRRNRLEVPISHPAAISHGLVIEGFDMRRGNTYARSLEASRLVAADADVALVPVTTNVRDLDLDDEFWDWEFHGAALASVAHVFAGAFDLAYIASGIEIESLFPWGSHPLVDPLYSSCDIKVRHDSAEVPRLEKIRLLAEWPIALDNMRVCYRHPQNSLNCEECEKCVRTMVELVAVGALERAGAFRHTDITAELVRAVRFSLQYHRIRWEEMIPDLERRGRSDLVAAIREIVTRFHRWDAWKHERDWKGRIKRFDRRFLGGRLLPYLRRLYA
ncbi:MAG: hypothetical protein GZ089_00125 [Aromatoleum sp.]|nr:hypothetical protein [Aromatoleum sp.]